MNKVFVRDPYNYDVDVVSKETGLECLDKSLTLQSEAEDADINTIVRRFGLTGQLPDNVRLPSYGDYTGINDYRTALDVVNAADKAFMSIPATVRGRFDNDPQMLLEFLSDVNNRDEAVQLGLIKEVSNGGSKSENADGANGASSGVSKGSADGKGSA